jgi:hypothetical protein
MGSLLSVIAVTVAANAPAALDGAAVKVRTERPPMTAGSPQMAVCTWLSTESASSSQGRDLRRAVIAPRGQRGLADLAPPGDAGREGAFGLGEPRREKDRRKSVLRAAITSNQQAGQDAMSGEVRHHLGGQEFG